MSKPIDKAKERFNEYAAMDAPQLPPWDMQVSALQVQLARWQQNNFGGATAEQIALGVSEEAGELAHAILKRSQNIRGMDDRDAFLEAAGDAIADCAIYLMQMATSLRLDFGELLVHTAKDVMKRKWKENPIDGQDSAQRCANCRYEITGERILASDGAPIHKGCSRDYEVLLTLGGKSKSCAHCDKTLGDRDNHYADIPGVGDLCNPCHEKWFEGEMA